MDVPSLDDLDPNQLPDIVVIEDPARRPWIVPLDEPTPTPQPGGRLARRTARWPEQRAQQPARRLARRTAWMPPRGGDESSDYSE